MSYTEYFFTKTGIFWVMLFANTVMAYADGMQSRGDKKNGKIVELFGLALMVCYGYLLPEYNILTSLIAFPFVRFGVFNITHNAGAKWRLDFVGKTDYIDLAIRGINKSGLFMLYLVSLLLGFGLVFNS